MTTATLHVRDLAPFALPKIDPRSVVTAVIFAAIFATGFYAAFDHLAHFMTREGIDYIGL